MEKVIPLLKRFMMHRWYHGCDILTESDLQLSGSASMGVEMMFVNWLLALTRRRWPSCLRVTCEIYLWVRQTGGKKSLACPAAKNLWTLAQRIKRKWVLRELSGSSGKPHEQTDWELIFHNSDWKSEEYSVILDQGFSILRNSLDRQEMSNVHCEHKSSAQTSLQRSVLGEGASPCSLKEKFTCWTEKTSSWPVPLCLNHPHHLPWIELSCLRYLNSLFHYVLYLLSTPTCNPSGTIWPST